MPTRPRTSPSLADLLERSARVVADTRETIRQTRRIIERCRQERRKHEGDGDRLTPATALRPEAPRTGASPAA